MLPVHNFSYGAVTPLAGFVMSSLGAYLGLRFAVRAREYTGAPRARWLLLAAVSIGTTGIWVMHFIAMLGYTIPGETIRYNVPVTIGSMLLAVAVVYVGLLIVGFGPETPARLLASSRASAWPGCITPAWPRWRCPPGRRTTAACSLPPC